MNKYDIIQYNINPQPIPSIYNDGYSQYETLTKLLVKINELIENQNTGADEIEELKSQKVSLEYYLNDLANNRKLSPTGDFTGTLNGMAIVNDSTGLSTTVAYHTTLFNKLSTKNVEFFGAVGDGVADDTISIQNAVNSGYSIEFTKNKTYYITNKIDVPSNTKINGNNAKIKFYNTTIVLNDMSVRAHWTGIFNIWGTKSATTSTILGYSTKKEPLFQGAWNVNNVEGFNINDYIEILVNGGYNVANTFNDYKPHINVIAKIIDIDTTNNIIYTDYYSPFDMSTTVYDTSTIITKLSTVDNVIIENFQIEDTTPGTNYSNVDGANKDKIICGVATNYASNVVVRNIKGYRMKNPLIMIHFCHNYIVENIEGVDPTYTGPAEGYAIKISHSVFGTVSKIYAKGCRHTVDLASSSFATISDCYDVQPYDDLFGYSFDLHGLCEHNITFRKCYGSFIFGNGLATFPCIENTVTLEDCKGDTNLGNVEELKIINSDIVLRTYSPNDSRVMSVSIENSKIQIGRSFNILGTKRGLNRKTKLSFINCDIKSYIGYAATTFTNNIIEGVDDVSILNCIIDFTETKQFLQISKALKIKMNDNEINNTGIEFLRMNESLATISYEFQNNKIYVSPTSPFVENALRNIIKLKNIHTCVGVLSICNNEITANGSVTYPVNIIDFKDGTTTFTDSDLTVVFNENTIINDNACANISAYPVSTRIKLISNLNSVTANLLYNDQLINASFSTILGSVVYHRNTHKFNTLSTESKLDIGTGTGNGASVFTDSTMLSIRKTVNGSYSKEMITFFYDTDLTQIQTSELRLFSCATLPTPRAGALIFYTGDNTFKKCTDGATWVTI